MHTPHILIIDDSDDILRLLEILFITEGYEVTTCVDGDQGIAAYKKGDIDVVVTDFLMPNIDGLDVLSAIRKSINPVPVILITGHASVEKAVEAMKGGAFDFLTKPVNNDQLLVTVKKALETRELILENLRLKKELSTQYGFENIVTDHPAMRSIFDTLRSIVETDVTVLLTGESGTGKELIARAIHYQSKRQPFPFVAVNCAAIPATLLESEFFGHEKGSFTGAISRREGKFESAHGGTLLLDEIGDMSLELQSKLLRVIEKQEFERVGGNKTVHCDVRIIASTNLDLSKAVAEKQFRQDLFYRLNVVVIHLPPLRERKSDIILIGRPFPNQIRGKI
jgi:DNA-binding NtrC family response regulator